MIAVAEQEFPSKVRPHPIPRDVIGRPRLLRILHSSIERKLTVVTAPAGYGKSTLLAQFVRDVEFPVCWLVLDAWDQEPSSFLENVVAAIRSRFPTFGDALLERLRTLKQFDEENRSLVGLLLKEFDSLGDYVALVLDDYHCVDTVETIQDFIQTLLAYLPDHIHVVVSSRTRPRFESLSRMMANRQASVLGAGDLAFTEEEAEQLIALLGDTELTVREKRDLVQRCDGWAAALVLSCFDAGQSSWTQGDGQLVDYLVDEILMRQEREVQNFLLKTSVLPSLRPELCDTVLGIANSQAILDKLTQINLVVAEEADGHIEYHYHSLTNEFLKRRFAAREPVQITKTLLAAAKLLKEAGLWHSALECYSDAAEWGRAATLVEDVADDLIQSGRWPQLAQALDKLPKHVLEARPALLVRRARCSIEEGRPDECLGLLDALLSSTSDSTHADEEDLARAYVAAAIALRDQGRLDDALSLVEKAWEFAQHLSRNSRLRAEVAHQFGIASAVKRDFRTARAMLQNALETSELCGDTARTSGVRRDLGGVCAEDGQFGEAVAHWGLALRGFESLGNQTDATLVLSNLGATYFFMAQYDLAREVLLKAATIGTPLEITRTLASTHLTLADVHRTLQHYSDALCSYQQGIDLARKCRDVQLLAYGTDGLAQTHLRTGELGKAQLLLDEALSLAESQRLVWQKGLFLITAASIRLIGGSPDDAEARLSEAVELLEGVDAPLEICRARLHLTNAYFVRGDTGDASDQLERLTNCLNERPSHKFLIPDLLHMPALLKWAVATHTGDGVYLALLRQVEESRALIGAAQSVAVEPVTESMFPDMEAYAFGNTRVTVNGKDVTNLEWRSAKARELFFFMARAPRPLTKEEIMASLWPEDMREKASNSFRCSLFRARHALYPECLIYSDKYYQFSPKSVFQFDLLDFSSIVERAEQIPEGSNLKSEFLEQAVALYKGPFLPEFYAEWCVTERRILEGRFLSVLATLAGYYADQQQFHRAGELCERILEIDIFDEEVLERAIRYYAKADNPAAAFRVYRSAERVYEQELGSPPSEHLRRLLQQLT